MSPPTFDNTPTFSPGTTGHVAATLVAATLAVVALPAAADEPDKDGQTDRDETGDVTVRTVDDSQLQRDDERFASGLAARVETGDLDFRGRDLGDAVSEVPGVYVRRQSSRGQPARVTIRGGSPRQTAVHLDGLRLSAPVGAGFDVGTIATGGIESVDVHRGSTAVTHGAGALSGALQLNPARATDDDVEWMARTRGGSFSTRGVDTAASVADDRAGLRLHSSLEASRGDFGFVDDHGNDHRRINNDHRRTDLGATGHIETDDHRVRIVGLFQSGRAGRPGPSQFQQTFDGARTTHRDGVATLRWEGRRLVDDSDLIVDGRATAGVRQRDHRYRNDEAALTGVAFDSRSTTRTAATTAGLDALIGDSHLARLDAEHRLETHAGVTESIDETRLQARRHTTGLTLSDHWLVADDHISLVGAIRAEHSRGRDETTFQPFLPAVGAIARIDEQLRLRANLTRTFRSPDFDELYLETETVRGNPDLDAEQAWTADAAVELGADDDPVGLQLAGFYHDIDSTILFLPVSSRLFEARNLHGATARGVETGLRTSLADRWRMRAGYTYTDAYLDGGDRDRRVQLPGRPRHRVTADATIDLTGLGFWSDLREVLVEPAARWRSTVHLDHFGHLRNDPTLRADLGVSIAPDARWQGGLQVRNIFDDRTSRDTLHRPLPGRSLFASVEISSN